MFGRSMDIEGAGPINERLSILAVARVQYSVTWTVPTDMNSLSGAFVSAIRPKRISIWQTTRRNWRSKSK